MDANECIFLRTPEGVIVSPKITPINTWIGLVSTSLENESAQGLLDAPYGLYIFHKHSNLILFLHACIHAWHCLYTTLRYVECTYVPVSSLVVSVTVTSVPILMGVVSVAHTCAVPPSSATLNMVGMDTMGAEDQEGN